VLTLFCFPCAGSSAVSYLNWRRLAPPWLHIETVDYPGRGSLFTKPPVREFGRLTSDLASAISRHHRSEFAFFGHSLGAIVAYECAHLLRQRGLPGPESLFLACSASPSTWNAARYRKIWTEEALVQELRDRNGTPLEVFDEPELMCMAVNQMDVDYAVCASYRYEREGHSLDIPIHVFGGENDDISWDSLSSWRFVTAAEAEITMVEGDHFFLKSNPQLMVDHIVSRVSRNHN
jgi:surfactin synthase thioesterase subunit